MTSELLILDDKPPARHLIAGWKRQWSDGGNISSGLPQYLVDQLGARKKKKKKKNRAHGAGNSEVMLPLPGIGDA